MTDDDPISGEEMTISSEEMTISDRDQGGAGNQICISCKFPSPYKTSSVLNLVAVSEKS